MRKRPERQLNAILLLGMRFIDNVRYYLLYRYFIDSLRPIKCILFTFLLLIRHTRNLNDYIYLLIVK